MASGSDEGEFKVWDLRFIQKNNSISCINWHKEPITSIDFCPHDSYTVGVACSDNRLSIWDLSVEKDDG